MIGDLHQRARSAAHAGRHRVATAAHASKHRVTTVGRAASMTWRAPVGQALSRLPTLPPRPRIPAERITVVRHHATGAAFDTAARVVGLRPEFVPAHFRRQLAVIGIDEPILRRVLNRIRSVADWAYAWEAEGDALLAHDDLRGAAAAYYIAQRVLVEQRPIKRRLYQQSVELYWQLEHPAPLERLEIEVPDGLVRGMLQVPASAPSPAPVVLVVPGITATKEEAHVIGEVLLPRGFALARMDNPGYGETEGVLGVEGPRNPARFVERLRQDPRLDPDRVYVLGLSMGAYFCLHSAAVCEPAAMVLVSSPYDPSAYTERFSPPSIRAMEQVTGQRGKVQLLELYEQIRVGPALPDVRCPLQLYHGGRDRLIPVSEAQRIATAVAGPCEVTIYPREGHVCVGKIFDVIAGALDLFSRRPHPSAWPRPPA